MIEYDENNPLHNRSITPDRHDLPPTDFVSENYGTRDLGGHFHKDDRGYLHRCYHKSASTVKVLAVAFAGEVLLFWPTHQLFHHLGWL
jgi:hypothetical protein